MSRAVSAIVNPKMLIWARECLCMTPDIAAARLDITVEDLLAYEAGLSQPTINKAKQMASLYNTLFAAFFLPDPPKKKPVIPLDFRRVGSKYYGSLSIDIIKQIIDIQNKRELAIDLLAELNEAIPPFDLSATLDESVDDVAKKIRDYFSLDNVQSRLSETDYKQRIYSQYKRRIEDRGLLIFQLKGIPKEEARAISLYNRLLPIVIINRQDWPAARTFSLFHEIAHLVFRVSGIFDTSEEDALRDFEYKCNAIAACTLMPKELFENTIVYKSHDVNNTWTDHEIYRISRIFGVSSEAVARRLYDLGHVEFKFYEEKKGEFRENISKLKKSNGAPPPATDAISRYGRRFLGIVLQAYSQELVSLTDITSLTGLKLKHLPQLIEEVFYDN